MTVSPAARNCMCCLAVFGVFALLCAENLQVADPFASCKGGVLLPGKHCYHNCEA